MYNCKCNKSERYRGGEPEIKLKQSINLIPNYLINRKQANADQTEEEKCGHMCIHHDKTQLLRVTYVKGTGG